MPSTLLTRYAKSANPHNKSIKYPSRLCVKNKQHNIQKLNITNNKYFNHEKIT